MNKKHLGLSLLIVLACTSGSAFAQVEQVTSMTVSNPAALIANVDYYRASGNRTAQSVTMLSHLHDGVDPSTHTIVAIYEDLETLESEMDKRATSDDWSVFRQANSSVATVNSSALAIQRQTWGKTSWEEGDYLAAVIVNTGEPKPWIAAVDKMMGSLELKNPGMFRIVRLRGAPGNHAVLITASSYAGLINNMEQLEASTEFETMRGATTVSVVDSTIYRVSKVWKP